MSILGRYKILGIGWVAIGKVHTGIIKPGMNITLGPSGNKTTCKSIELHHEGRN